MAGGANRGVREAHTHTHTHIRWNPGNVVEAGSRLLCRTSSSATFWPGRVKRETETLLVDWGMSDYVSLFFHLRLETNTRGLAQRDTGRKEATTQNARFRRVAKGIKPDELMLLFHLDSCLRARDTVIAFAQKRVLFIRYPGKYVTRSRLYGIVTFHESSTSSTFRQKSEFEHQK